jgi:hypothetical protein
MREAPGKGKLLAGLVLIPPLLYLGWQVGACEIANLELNDDLRDIAAQVGTKIGLDPIREDAELRAMVVRRAEDYDIPLQAEQVSVERSGAGDQQAIRLTVDYRARVHFLAYSFTLHFRPSSGLK